MAHAGKARLLREKGMARTQVWRISMGKDGAPFFISTPTHAAPHEPLFEQLQEDMDTLFGPDHLSSFLECSLSKMAWQK